MHATTICLFWEGSFTRLLGVNEGLTAANCARQQAASGPGQPRPPEATRREAAIRQPPGQVHITTLWLSCPKCKVNILNIIL